MSRIARVETVDRRKKKVLRKKPCVELEGKCRVVILEKSRITWAGQVERTDEDCLPRKADTLFIYVHQNERRRRRGIQRLKWLDCNKRYGSGGRRGLEDK